VSVWVESQSNLLVSLRTDLPVFTIAAQNKVGPGSAFSGVGSDFRNGNPRLPQADTKHINHAFVVQKLPGVNLSANVCGALAIEFLSFYSMGSIIFRPWISDSPVLLSTSSIYGPEKW
jgi:hypothetical protein